METKKLRINNQVFEYKLRRTAYAKHVRLTIDYDGTLIVGASRTYPVFLIKKYIFQKWNWIIKSQAKQLQNPSILAIKHYPAQIKRLKEETRKLVHDRLEHFNKYYGFKYNKVAIRDQKSRWGSCSSKKNLNFNYRLCLIPRDLADYIVVHELCHLGQMNHSKHYWALVEKTMPDYKVYEKQLNKI